MHNHNTLILAAGRSQFLCPDGSQISKYEYNVSGKTLIERITSTYISGNTYLALSRADMSINLKDIENIPVEDTKGALASALIALRDCDLDLPVFITPGDALISKKHYDDFCLESLQSNEDISLIVFDSNNPKYSYVRMLNKKLVEVCEKKVISSKATAGIFYFKSGHLFMECAEWAIMNNFKTNGLFFLATALNYAVLKGLNPILFQIDEENYYRFSSHDEAVESERRYKNESQ